MANKMTKRDYFAVLRETFPTDHPKYEEVIHFIDHEVELLTKKNSADKKPTAQQKLNKEVKEKILDAMAPNTLYTVTEIMKLVDVPDLTNQRVSALLRQMMPTQIVRTEDKRKAYFSKVVEGD